MKIKISGWYAALLACAVFIVGCGQPVPQNKLALVVRTIGERSATNAVAATQIYWASRLPFGISVNPAVRVFTFPLGLQDYSFNAKPSYESPVSNPIEIDCLGGHLSFDVNLQLYIDRSVTNLSERLLQFINDHQLQSYKGEPDMLSRWAGEKLKQFVREPLAQYGLNRQAIDIMHAKGEMDTILLNKMNSRFNKYGIIFSAAGITSHIALPQDQKDKMNNIVKQEYANRALELREQQFMPLALEINRIEQDGLNQVQAQKNRGISESIKLVAAAQQQRRQTFIDLVGKQQYVELEQMLLTVKGLEGGPTKVYLVPKTVSYVQIDGAEKHKQ